MTKQQALELFEERGVRTVWDDEQEKWYFSIVDVVAVLTDSSNPQTYWRVLKKRLLAEGNETVTNCNGFFVYIFIRNACLCGAVCVFDVFLLILLRLFPCGRSAQHGLFHPVF